MNCSDVSNCQKVHLAILPHLLPPIFFPLTPNGNLLFGHGDQNNFHKNNEVSINDLCYNQRIRTKEILGNNTNFYKSTFKHVISLRV